MHRAVLRRLFALSALERFGLGRPFGGITSYNFVLDLEDFPLLRLRKPIFEREEADWSFDHGRVLPFARKLARSGHRIVKGARQGWGLQGVEQRGFGETMTSDGQQIETPGETEVEDKVGAGAIAGYKPAYRFLRGVGTGAKRVVVRPERGDRVFVRGAEMPYLPAGNTPESGEVRGDSALLQSPLSFSALPDRGLLVTGHPFSTTREKGQVAAATRPHFDWKGYGLGFQQKQKLSRVSDAFVPEAGEVVVSKDHVLLPPLTLPSPSLQFPQLLVSDFYPALNLDAPQLASSGLGLHKGTMQNLARRAGHGERGLQGQFQELLRMAMPEALTLVILRKALEGLEREGRGLVSKDLGFFTKMSRGLFGQEAEGASTRGIYEAGQVPRYTAFAYERLALRETPVHAGRTVRGGETHTATGDIRDLLRISERRGAGHGGLSVSVFPLSFEVLAQMVGEGFGLSPSDLILLPLLSSVRTSRGHLSTQPQFSRAMMGSWSQQALLGGSTFGAPFEQFEPIFIHLLRRSYLSEGGAQEEELLKPLSPRFGKPSRSRTARDSGFVAHKPPVFRTPQRFGGESDVVRTVGRAPTALQGSKRPRGFVPPHRFVVSGLPWQALYLQSAGLGALHGDFGEPYYSSTRYREPFASELDEVERVFLNLRKQFSVLGSQWGEAGKTPWQGLGSSRVGDAFAPKHGGLPRGVGLGGRAFAEPYPARVTFDAGMGFEGRVGAMPHVTGSGAGSSSHSLKAYPSISSAFEPVLLALHRSALPFEADDRGMGAEGVRRLKGGGGRGFVSALRGASRIGGVFSQVYSVGQVNTSAIMAREATGGAKASKPDLAPFEAFAYPELLLALTRRAFANSAVSRKNAERFWFSNLSHGVPVGAFDLQLMRPLVELQTPARRFSRGRVVSRALGAKTGALEDAEMRLLVLAPLAGERGLLSSTEEALAGTRFSRFLEKGREAGAGAEEVSSQVDSTRGVVKPHTIEGVLPGIPEKPQVFEWDMEKVSLGGGGSPLDVSSDSLGFFQDMVGSQPRILGTKGSELALGGSLPLISQGGGSQASVALASKAQGAPKGGSPSEEKRSSETTSPVDLDVLAIEMAERIMDRIRREKERRGHYG
jgi:hypothetical protein